ncbi:MAG TPA: hypothetical protein VKV06_14585 [Acidimicrobiales bacterium]|nr:hypothetical protein [Acidimicrobiales bacterium]
MTPGDGPPPDAHEWVSFEDDEEERTWVFDLTFLRSGWRCIFGAGCQGVLTAAAPELERGCCSYGAHFTDDADVERVLAAAGTLTDDQWQMKPQVVDRDGSLPDDLVTTEEGGARVTRLVDDACVFLNRPGFPGGAGCALHRAALETGRLPLELKPDVCWQLPLRRDETVDDRGHVTTTITQWERRHWGAGGDDFHWWCTEAPEAFTSPEPVWRTLAAELVALVGPTVYLKLVGYIRHRESDGVPLPHPAVRPRSRS